MEIQQYIDDEKDYEENLLKFIESGNTVDMLGGAPLNELRKPLTQ